jgi:hypothetical protein
VPSGGEGAQMLKINVLRCLIIFWIIKLVQTRLDRLVQKAIHN